MVKVVLGLGSNIGQRLNYLKKAVKGICLIPGFDYLALSGIYETEPWGFKNQNKFLNCILVCLCRLEPEETIRALRNVERETGRKQREKWRKREIDIDILLYGDRIVNKAGLIIPHPQLVNRNFVLKPLAELAPGFVHPVLKKSMEYLNNHTTDKNKVYLYSEKL
jgi:2-amino-4-hydroxy-6-hydroxymethyldihydropteridine diphosphokinase